MSILVNSDTRIVVQGITGSEGAFHTARMKEYGTHIVAGVTPGKGGSELLDTPVFNCVRDAVRETGADTSIIFVPPRFASDAILEAVDAGVGFVVCITEGVPALDMMEVKKHIRQTDTKLLGPNCPGIISPGQCKLGIMPASIHQPGRIGVISRSGTLTYEVVAQLTGLGHGQSTAIGIGGDPIPGMDFVDALKLFEADPDTDAVVMIGEIGGNAEERAAEFVRQSMTKPVVGFVAGKTAPPGKRMGHAGAIISGGKGTADDKLQAMQHAGIITVENPAEIGDTLVAALKH